MRSLTAAVTQVATFGAFAKAIPDRLAASPASGNTIMNVRTIDRRGRTIMASIGPVGGGAGGMPTGDGAEGAGANSSFLKNTPVEINEAEVPIRFSRYGLWSDTGGAGRWRGGSSTVMEFEVFAPQTMITARNRDRSNFGSWGLKGGYSGANSSFVRNPGRNDEEILGNRDIVNCNPGDVIRIVGPAGAGWGDPLDRPLSLIEFDLACAYISKATARERYGVVFADSADADTAYVDAAIDAEATACRRRELRVERPLFDFGPGRSAFEVVWSKERYDALTDVLAQTLVPWRHWVKKAIFAAVSTEANLTAPAAQVRAIYARLCAQFPQLVEAAERPSLAAE
jgi:N-methylhydantoinase B